MLTYSAKFAPFHLRMHGDAILVPKLCLNPLDKLTMFLTSLAGLWQFPNPLKGCAQRQNSTASSSDGTASCTSSVSSVLLLTTSLWRR